MGKIFLFILLLIPVIFGFSSDQEKEISSESQDNIQGELKTDIKIELQFYTQTYRLNDPIYVLINIVNVSDKDYNFTISSLIYETFFFIMRTPKNEVINLLDQFQIEKMENASASGDYREIKLQPGEVFSRKIDITQWFDIKESGYYYLKGIFHPNPDIKNKSYESFDYKILVRPPLIIENKLIEDELKQHEIIETVKKFPPDEAIIDFLDAKMKKDWERFLSHIDHERLIQSFDNYRNAYENARSGRYKLEIIGEFKNYLTTYWQDRILKYEIIETMIRQDKATVTCEVEYKVRNTSYMHRYEFYLYKNHANQWLIYDYIVLRMKDKE